MIKQTNLNMVWEYAKVGILTPHIPFYSFWLSIMYLSVQSWWLTLHKAVPQVKLVTSSWEELLNHKNINWFFSQQPKIYD